MLAAVATLLVIIAVWLIARLDVRGQYLMAVAQVAWGNWAAVNGDWWLCAQSVILFVFAIHAIRHWRRNLKVEA